MLKNETEVISQKENAAIIKFYFANARRKFDETHFYIEVLGNSVKLWAKFIEDGGVKLEYVIAITASRIIHQMREVSNIKDDPGNVTATYEGILCGNIKVSRHYYMNNIY